MHIQSVNDRVFIEEAAALIAEHGDDAVLEAASIASRHQNAGDLCAFARWRQIERAVLMLQLVDVVGELH